MFICLCVVLRGKKGGGVWLSIYYFLSVSLLLTLGTSCFAFSIGLNVMFKREREKEYNDNVLVGEYNGMFVWVMSVCVTANLDTQEIDRTTGFFSKETNVRRMVRS